MEKTHTRREFIRTAGIVAATSAVFAKSWANGLQALYNLGINPSGEFSLLKIEQLLQDYRLPERGSFTNDSFSMYYKLLNIYGNHTAPAGNMKWQLDPEENRNVFRFSVKRNAGNGIMDKSKSFLYITEGEVTCSKNDTLTPEKWNVSKRISLNNANEGYQGTGQVSSGTFENNQIRTSSGKKKINRKIGSLPLSWKWGVMSIVQNFAKNNIREVHFSALDEFDALYSSQSVSFVKDIPLECNGTQRNFKIFLHTGDGIIPTVYWVDDFFRTVFVLTGMEAYVLFENNV